MGRRGDGGQMLVKKINGRYLIDAICSGIRDAVDSRCQSVLQDVLSFLESPKAALRLKGLAAYSCLKCFNSFYCRGSRCYLLVNKVIIWLLIVLHAIMYKL